MKHVTLTATLVVACAGLSALTPAADPLAAPAPKLPPAEQQPTDKQPTCRVCGGTCHLEPVCVCAPATKKKIKTTYSMKCEPVCVPEPCLSHHGKGRPHVGSCTGTACDGSCGAVSVRTKKTLLKTMTEEEVDVVERKVEYRCRPCAELDAAPTCCSCAGHGPAPASRPWWKSLWPW